MVRLSRDSSWICLEVADQGPGIPEEELPRIWESFFRGERARNSPNRGSGLGLAVVRQLVELHGGRVEAESQLGRGHDVPDLAAERPAERPRASPHDGRRRVTALRQASTSGVVHSLMRSEGE